MFILGKYTTTDFDELVDIFKFVYCKGKGDIILIFTLKGFSLVIRLDMISI